MLAASSAAVSRMRSARLARSGCSAQRPKVTIASSDQSRLDAALAALPGGCDGVVADARSEASVAEALAQIGELDHLVYTAGDSVVPRPPPTFT